MCASRLLTCYIIITKHIISNSLWEVLIMKNSCMACVRARNDWLHKCLHQNKFQQFSLVTRIKILSIHLSSLFSSFLSTLLIFFLPLLLLIDDRWHMNGTLIIIIIKIYRSPRTLIVKLYLYPSSHPNFVSPSVLFHKREGKRAAQPSFSFFLPLWMSGDK